MLTFRLRRLFTLGSALITAMFLLLNTIAAPVYAYAFTDDHVDDFVQTRGDEPSQYEADL